MQIANEVLAMTPILWKDSEVHRHEGKQEVKSRIRLLGVAAPRNVFSWKSFKTLVAETRIEATNKPHYHSFADSIVNEMDKGFVITRN
jgi:hypothetical protein